MVCPAGRLDSVTYRQFSDDLVKFAIEEPRAVIVVVDDLVVRAEPLPAAFTSAWMRVEEWPGVPIVLVAIDDRRRRALAGSAVIRYLPVFGTVTAAVRGIDAGSRRRRETLDLAPAADCGQLARAFVARICERWGVPEVRADAQLVVTELAENAFLHSLPPGDIRIRLELREQLFTVAVSDGDPREAVLREPVPGVSRFYGLHVVGRLAKAWGCAPQWPRGKVVWAVLAVGSPR